MDPNRNQKDKKDPPGERLNGENIRQPRQNRTQEHRTRT